MTSPAGIAALGHEVEVAGFALAGVAVHAVESPADAVAAWSALPDTTGLVILGPDAARALATQATARPDRLTVVLPA